MTETEFSLIVKWFQLNSYILKIDNSKNLPFTTYENNLPTLGFLNIENNSTILVNDQIKYPGVSTNKMCNRRISKRYIQVFRFENFY